MSHSSLSLLFSSQHLSMPYELPAAMKHAPPRASWCLPKVSETLPPAEPLAL